jgi:hypothetical protein
MCERGRIDYWKEHNFEAELIIGKSITLRSEKA